MKKLTSLETILKDAFLNYPYLKLNVPFRNKNLPENLDFDKKIVLEQLLKELNHDKLSEQDIIENKADVAITKHIRYLPANYHYHEFFEIIYVLEGTCFNYFENHFFNLKKGDVMIIAPHTLHAVSGFSDELQLYNILIRKSTFNTSFFSLLEDKDVLSSFFLKVLYGKNQTFLYFHTDPRSDLKDFILFMAKEATSNYIYSDRMIKNLVNTFFIVLLREFHLQKAQLAAETLDDSETISILQYIENNFESLSILELAKKFNYSQRQISRILKKSTEKNFSQIILDLKIKKAKQYLKKTDLPIQEIAELVGYPDLSNFYRYFSKKAGTSPKNYRIELQQNEKKLKI